MANIDKYKITEEQIRNVAEKDAASIMKDWEQGLISTEDALQKFAKVGQETAKSVARMGSEFAKMTIASKKYTDSLTQQALKEQNTKKSFFERIGFTAHAGQDQLATQYKARQMAGGIESILSGNFASGARQIASTFPKIANFMGGPYYLALTTVVRGLLKFDDALAKASATAASLSGGLDSAYLGKGARSMEFNAKMKNALYDIGMQNEFDNIRQAVQKGYGFSSYQGKQQDYISTLAYAQKGLGAYGIDANSANSLISNLRMIEGKDQQGVYASLQRLTDRFKTSTIMSPEQALQQATSLYDQTKHLGTNFEWASRTIKVFENELKRGTMSLSDFAAGNRALQSGGVSKNAGIASLLTDYATRNGIALPSIFTNSNAIGQGFALSSPDMLGSNAIAKAMSGKITEMINQMDVTSKYEKAGALQLILQSMGINVSATAAQNAITNSGTIDLQKAGIMGSGAFEKKALEERQAKDYENKVKKYYEGTTSWHNKLLDDIGQIVSNTAPKFSRGFTGDISDEGSVKEFIGFFANPGNWLPGFVKDIVQGIVDGNAHMYGSNPYPISQNKTT